MSSKILVADDDLAIVEMLTMVMEREGFGTVVVNDDFEAVKATGRENPDLTLLDLMLPGMSGVGICRAVRKTSAVPIIILAAKTNTVDVALGLESGTDDYVTKSFKPRELMVRVRARPHRQEDSPSETLEVGNLTIDVPGHAVFRDGKKISLAPLEFDLLHALAPRPKRIFFRDELSEKVWGYQHTSGTQLVNVHVQRLHSKIELDPGNPQIVLTIRGAGYKTGDQSKPVSPSGNRFLRRLITKLRNFTNRGMTWAVTLQRTFIQVRILTSVVVLNTMVIAVLDFALATIVTRRLTDAKVTVTDEEIDRARTVVERVIRNFSSNELQALLNVGHDALVNRTAGSDTAPLTSYKPLPLASVPRGTVLASPSIKADVPERLHEVVRQEQIAYQTRQVTDNRSDMYSTLAIGSPTSTSVDRLELYLVTSMVVEESTIKLVRGLLAGATVVIVALLDGITWLFPNQVTTPVRSAAQVAQRFADGRSRERMIVQGEDDMARLAMSFNKIAEPLSTQIRQLEEYGSLQRQLTSDASHELRTPLATVRMAADLITDGAEDLDPATRHAAELMNEEPERFEALLSNLPEIPRHDAGAADLSVEKVDARRCVGAAYQQIAVVAKETGTPIHFHLPDEPVMTTVGSRRIEHVLRNFMANATGRSESNPANITVRSNNSAVSFTVVDRDVGLEPGQRELVFNHFWRADPSRVRHTGGTGFGLAIAREDAQLHGEELEAFDVPTIGSCFRLTVPLEPEAGFGEHPLGLEAPPLSDQIPHQQEIGARALESESNVPQVRSQDQGKGQRTSDSESRQAREEDS